MVAVMKRWMAMGHLESDCIFALVLVPLVRADVTWAHVRRRCDIADVTNVVVQDGLLCHAEHLWLGKLTFEVALDLHEVRFTQALLVQFPPEELGDSSWHDPASDLLPSHRHPRPHLPSARLEANDV